MANRPEQLYSQIGQFTPDNLFAGLEVTPLIKGVVLDPGIGIVVRGTVLGRNDATGQCTPVDSSQSDGTENPYAILATTVDTTGDDTVAAEAYYTGVFNALALVFGGTDTLETHDEALRKLGILTKTNVPY